MKLCPWNMTLIHSVSPYTAGSDIFSSTSVQYSFCEDRTEARTSIFFICLCALLSEKSLPTVKLWKLCVASNFCAVSLNFSIISGPTRHALFRLRSCSFSSEIEPAGLSLEDQKSDAREDGVLVEDAERLLWRPEPGLGGMRR